MKRKWTEATYERRRPITGSARENVSTIQKRNVSPLREEARGRCYVQDCENT